MKTLLTVLLAFTIIGCSTPTQIEKQWEWVEVNNIKTQIELGTTERIHIGSDYVSGDSLKITIESKYNSYDSPHEFLYFLDSFESHIADEIPVLSFPDSYTMKHEIPKGDYFAEVSVRLSSMNPPNDLVKPIDIKIMVERKVIR